MCVANERRIFSQYFAGFEVLTAVTMDVLSNVLHLKYICAENACLLSVIHKDP
jgi:hypothetical protein